MKRYTEADVRKELDRRIATQGLRGFCRNSGILDPGFVSDVRRGKKRLSATLARALGFEEMERAFVRRTAKAEVGKLDDAAAGKDSKTEPTR